MATLLYVQFTDGGEDVIQSIFSCPQDPNVWPNQGTVYSDDARYEAFYDALPIGMKGMFITPGE